MYPLFELRNVLHLNKANEIVLSAYLEVRDKTVLALVCSNGCLLFFNSCASVQAEKPWIRQLQWFTHPGKEIKALCFDPFGFWLLVAVTDGSLYIIPAPAASGHPPKCSSLWRTDDLTDIRLSGQRALPTSIKWWNTSEGQHIAVIGNELGEISFINLKTGKEMGSTYVPVHAQENAVIENLDLVHDEENGTTSLLITDSTKQQWHLLLEDCKSDFYWLAESESEIHVGVGSVDRKVWQMQGERSLFIEDKRVEGRPRRLSKFAGAAYLFPQIVRGRTLIAAYNSMHGKLQILPSSMELPYLSMYEVPENCEHLLLVDKFIFLMEHHEKMNNSFRIVSCHFADSSKKGKDNGDAEIQNIAINGCVQALYKRSASYYLTAQQAIARKNQSCSSKNNSQLASTKTAMEKFTMDDIAIQTSFDGCFIVHKKGLIECRPRDSPEKQFLALTSNPDDLPMAERLGIMLSLNISGLYEMGAELQLAQGHFAQAVRLYQLSKCPQLKRVAHFVSYGFLSELIAYIQVLFSTKSMDIAPADRSHFSNIALHCFVQQILNRKNERQVVTQAFRDFLRDNLYYDDEVAIRLLSEQGLYDLLLFCADLHGQQRLMLEHLLSADCQRESVDQQAHDAIVNSSYSSVLSRVQNESYLACITSPELLQHMATKPQLLKCHIQHMAQLLPNMSTELLLRAARLYDPSHPAAELAVRSVLTFHSHRYFSMSSLSSISSDSLDLTHGDDESMSEEELIKFFIFILLLLNHKRGIPIFQMKLMLNGNDKKKPEPTTSKCRKVAFDVSLSCGLSHSAFAKQGSLFTWGKGHLGRLGHGEVHQETSQPMHVDLLDLKVLTVSCGALHTLALTEYGVFGWGSSKYGQLGMGELQRTARPLLLETFVGQEISSIVCGQYHSLAFTTDGRVFSWGWGVHGQLGHGNVEDCHFPKEIEFFKGEMVIAVAAGHGHSAVLVKTGDVYTFGCGMFGQLGLGTAVKHSIPQCVHLLEPIVQISSGYFHMLALSGTSNKLYIWGCNPQALRLQAQTTRRARLQSSQGQENPIYGTSPHLSGISTSFGQNVFSQTHLFPSLVQTSSVSAKIAKLACGSHHSALLTVDGEVYTWGRNTEGQLGHGTRKEQKWPTMLLSLNDRKVTHITCGNDFMLAFDSTGRLWGWGQNDGAQLGQKPAVESRSRPTVSHSQGRVITIRTNRRMITFTQSCRQGELRPIEVISIPSVPGISAIDLDSNSLDSDVTLLHQMDYYHKTHSSPVIPYLSSMDQEPYGPFALHAVLKAFHRYYDPSSILTHCISFSDLQAAAKLCVLEGLYAQALEYQLKALGTTEKEENKIVTLGLEILKFYLNYVDPENTESNKQFLSHVIVFWEEHCLPNESLENLLSSQLGLLGYPLGLLLYCEGLKKEEILSFQRKLSTNFCIQVSLTIVDHVDSGKPHPDLLEHLVQTSGTADLLRSSDSELSGWESSLPPHTLWKELLRNFQKGALARSSVHLASGSIDSLAKALLAEEKQDIVVFTCGHHYTRHNFATSVLPCFREALQKIPIALPQTERLLLSGYQSEGTIPTACPPCVLTEIKS